MSRTKPLTSRTNPPSPARDGPPPWARPPSAVTALATTMPSAEAVPTAATTLVVNANQTLRPVTHVASGSLYGLADDMTPADSLATCPQGQHLRADGPGRQPEQYVNG